MAGHRSYITTESHSCADGANVSSVWPIFIIMSLNSEAPDLKKKIFYFFQFAFTSTYKCPQRRGYISASQQSTWVRALHGACRLEELKLQSWKQPGHTE